MNQASGKYRVSVPDYDYYRRLVNCQYECPVNTDARGYVRAIAEGDFQRAYMIAREPNPFASICGRVCGAPCEAACRRGKIDEAVAIRALKRFVTERHGIEEEHQHLRADSTTPGSVTIDSRSILGRLGSSSRGQRVAIVGAGPAGMSAAHDLALLGYRTTVFEAQSVPGGMLVLGIPEYRLARDLIRKEIQSILDLGVDLKLNSRLGTDFDLEQLRQEGYEAVFLAIGAHQSRLLQIEGVENDGVLRAIDFLLNANMGYKVDLGRRVLVIGGGNVAVDVARSALRRIGETEDLGTEDMRKALAEAQAALRQVAQIAETQPDEMKIAIDVARSALRLGVKEVYMACLESREEMPADKVEIEDALDEGIKLFNSKGPKKILSAHGKATGVEFLDVASVFDSNGRFNPTFKSNTETTIEADTIILAIGQKSDLSFLKAGDGVKVTPRGTIEIDPETLASSAPGVFAGGDLAFGPRLIINAVADGKKAARAIAAYLSGKNLSVSRQAHMTVSTDNDRFRDRLSQARERVPARPIDRRIGITEVELGFGQPAAERQARRCLNCSIHPVFNGDRCVLCGGCVDVCPEHCLKLVSVAKVIGGEDLNRLLRRVMCDGAEDTGKDDIPSWSVMLKDEDKCIRCGLCAERCPNEAVTMEAFQFCEQLVLGPEVHDDSTRLSR
jgi:formate dehydrogenase beta subunit